VSGGGTPSLLGTEPLDVCVAGPVLIPVCTRRVRTTSRRKTNFASTRVDNGASETRFEERKHDRTAFIGVLS